MSLSAAYAWGHPLLVPHPTTPFEEAANVPQSGEI